MLLLVGCALCAVNVADAQTKRRNAAPQKFSVPCAKALQIGLSAVENLHSKDVERRTKGKTDSGTEGDATQNALKNYLACRRADNAARLKSFGADQKADVNSLAATAKNVARSRFDELIYGISWDEKGADSINYSLTLRAVALVEDYKSEIINAFENETDFDEQASETAARRDEKLIREMLVKMENRSFDDAADAKNYQLKLTALKTSVNQFLQENSAHDKRLKAAAAIFVVKLLTLGSPEN